MSGFDKLSLEGSSGDLIITQGTTEGLEVETDDNLMQYISSEVAGDTLTIKNIKSIRPTSIIYRLKLKTLKDVIISGMGDLKAENLIAEDLKFKVSGAGNITINNLKAKSIETLISGAGDINIAGKVERQKIKISGAGDYKAKNLESLLASIKISGAGDAVISVSESLEASISGVGDIRYYGNPKLSSEISGHGKITKVEDNK